jgi:hypothetical protein
MTTDQKLTAVIRILRLLFPMFRTFLPANVEREVSQTLDALSNNSQSVSSNVKKGGH